MTANAIAPVGIAEDVDPFPGIKQMAFAVTPTIPKAAVQALASDCDTLFSVLHHEHKGTELADAFELACLVLHMLDGCPADPITYGRALELYACLGGTFAPMLHGCLDGIKREAVGTTAD